MSKKNKITKIIINIFGLISLYLFIILRFNGEPEHLLDSEFFKAYKNYEYGDLYFLNYIDNFRIPTPPLEKEYFDSEPKTEINDAEILIFGDSFFAVDARVKNVPGRITETLKKKVFFIRSNDVLSVLEMNKYVKKDRKYLILESVERNIPELLAGRHNIMIQKKSTINDIIEIVKKVNLEQRYTYILQRGFLTHYMYKKLATLKFNLFGYITSLTPVYKKEPPWLFYCQEVDDRKTSFYYKFTDEEITTICDNLLELNNQLIEKYNIDLIFLPIPNKYTIYHKLLNNDEYNNFLPKIYSEMIKRNVKVCNIYDSFINSEKELYYPTDTHWNEEGIKITVSQLLRIIDFENK